MPSRRRLPPCSDHQHTTLTPVAAVITLKVLARVAIRHAEAAEHGDHADPAQAGEVRAAAGGAFREVVEGVQSGFVALDALMVFLLAGSYFALSKRGLL